MHSLNVHCLLSYVRQMYGNEFLRENRNYTQAKTMQFVSGINPGLSPSVGMKVKLLGIACCQKWKRKKKNLINQCIASTTCNHTRSKCAGKYERHESYPKLPCDGVHVEPSNATLCMNDMYTCSSASVGQP